MFYWKKKTTFLRPGNLDSKIVHVHLISLQKSLCNSSKSFTFNIEPTSQKFHSRPKLIHVEKKTSPSTQALCYRNSFCHFPNRGRLDSERLDSDSPSEVSHCQSRFFLGLQAYLRPLKAYKRTLLVYPMTPF